MITHAPLRIAETPLMQVRPSIRVARAAEIMDVDISTIYRMVYDGELESHSVGRGNRNIRIYIDSLQSYQEGRTRQVNPEKIKNKSRRPIHRAAFNEAMAFLQKKGIVLHK